MKICITTVLAVFLFQSVQAQSSFDIFSYKTPSGFSLIKNNEYLCFQNNEGKNYCQLFLYPATLGDNNIEKDFDKNWDFFARNPSQKLGDPETKEADSINGWQTVFGAAKGTFNKQMFAVTLLTFTKDRITYFIASVFTDKKYIPIVQAFIDSVIPHENKFVQHKSISQPDVNTVNWIATGSSGITQSTTRFEDGWTSTIHSEYVEVKNNGTEVRLYYVDLNRDLQRDANTATLEPYYWDKIVTSAYTASLPYVREKEQYSYGGADIWEASVTNKLTGKTGYLGMRLVFDNGSCRPIVVVARDKNTYYNMFSSDADFTKMLSYNKFAVTQQDLIGKWKSFEATSMGYYSIYTGEYAGMATASTNDEFVFNNNGTYQSIHAGTSSFNGSVSHGQSSYKGSFNVNNWILTASSRGANDPGEFSCQFEAVKGGYMLRLINRTFSGEAMTLFKTK